MLTDQQPGTTGLAEAAEKVSVVAAEHAADADRDRVLSPEVVEAVTAAGFARHFVAAEWGGTEGSFDELTRAVLTVGEGCAAAAWCASLAAYSARFAAHLPLEGHRALWEGSPDATIAAGLIPSGRAVPADGGWRLTGEWKYVSGVDFADWVLLCGAAPGADGTDGTHGTKGTDGADAKPEPWFFALPRGTYTVHETWDNAGMRATGSHTVAVDAAYVPRHLSFPRAEMITGRNSTSQLPAHNVPFQAVGGLTFIAPAAGAAAGALRAASGLVTGRHRTPSAETKVVRASGRLDAAVHLVRQNAEVIDERRFTPELMARNERNATFAAELLQETVGLLVQTCGTSGLAAGRPLERFWRDVTSATSHVALQYDTAARKNYSAVLLGPAEG